MRTVEIYLEVMISVTHIPNVMNVNCANPFTAIINSIVMKNFKAVINSNL